MLLYKWRTIKTAGDQEEVQKKLTQNNNSQIFNSELELYFLHYLIK